MAVGTGMCALIFVIAIAPVVHASGSWQQVPWEQIHAGLTCAVATSAGIPAGCVCDGNDAIASQGAIVDTSGQSIRFTNKVVCNVKLPFSFSKVRGHYELHCNMGQTDYCDDHQSSTSDQFSNSACPGTDSYAFGTDLQMIYAGGSLGANNWVTRTQTIAETVVDEASTTLRWLYCVDPGYNEEVNLRSISLEVYTSATTTTTTTAGPKHCSAEDSCRFCRDGAFAVFDPNTTDTIIDGGGYCILNKDKVCVDVYTRGACSADNSACPADADSNLEQEYLQPVWYQNCQGTGRKIVMGPDGCSDRGNVGSGMCAASR